MPKPAIKAENIGKKFCKGLRGSMLYGITDILRSAAGIAPDAGKLRRGEFWAVKDVSFELAKGETLAIIGPNGSGKTTILKMLNGIFMPDKGKIRIDGRVGTLIQVGAGFHPMLTGRENIYINGAILGMKRDEIKRRLDSIVDFADIGGFLDSPVKYYSSGMYVRLGFAIAVHSNPDILLIDEILAVGDLSFKQKCFAKMAGIVKEGTTIVFVSHDIIAVQKLCNSAIVLHRGEVERHGPVQHVLGGYYDVCRSHSALSSEAPKRKSSFGITYRELNFFNHKDERTKVFESGEDIIAEWSFDMKDRIENPSVHFSIMSDEYSYNGYSTYFDNFNIPYIDAGTTVRIRIKRPFLGPGQYIVSIGLWDEKFLGSYFWDYETTGRIEVISKRKMLGRFEFEHEWEIIQRGSRDGAQHSKETECLRR